MILFTAPDKIEGEEAFINQLFELGLMTLHLRKPQFNWDEMELFLKNIKSDFYSRMMIHSHFELMENFNLKGIHFSEKMKSDFDKYAYWNCTKSWALHNLDEINSIPDEVNYCFLSPIFPSVSKDGYAKEWDFDTLSSTLKNRINKACKVVALGGVTLENATQCQPLSFDDFAVLGTVWEPFQQNQMNEAKNNFIALNKI